jgi:hypothetical protein
MRHVHSLCFEVLDARQLLSGAHLALSHAARIAAAPLVLDGTLSVDNNSNAISSTMNADGSSTMSIAVAGQLGALGPVHGVWYESQDAFGEYEGPDTLRLRDTKGTITITFNNVNRSPAHANERGAVNYEHAQRFYSGTGAYARASEIGTIELTTNAAQTHVVSMTLHTTHP